MTIGLFSLLCGENYFPNELGLWCWNAIRNPTYTFYLIMTHTNAKVEELIKPYSNISIIHVTTDEIKSRFFPKDYHICNNWNYCHIKPFLLELINDKHDYVGWMDLDTQINDPFPEPLTERYYGYEQWHGPICLGRKQPPGFFKLLHQWYIDHYLQDKRCPFDESYWYYMDGGTMKYYLTYHSYSSIFSKKDNLTSIFSITKDNLYDIGRKEVIRYMNLDYFFKKDKIWYDYENLQEIRFNVENLSLDRIYK